MKMTAATGKNVQVDSSQLLSDWGVMLNCSTTLTSVSAELPKGQQSQTVCSVNPKQFILL